MIHLADNANVVYESAATALAEFSISAGNGDSKPQVEGRACHVRGDSAYHGGNGQSGAHPLRTVRPGLASPNQQPRIALYSHDTLGLGHLRRNLLIAEALTRSPLHATNLLVTGAHESNFFNLPGGVDCLSLPRLQKGNDGSYESGQLAISVKELVQLRAETIASAIARFDPDMLIVDKVPAGAFGELLPTLRRLAGDTRTRCVLGVRDVLDDPATVRREWATADSTSTIDEFYDAIWVYGDQHIYDPRAEYQWSPRLKDMTEFTGYLDQSARLTASPEAGDCQLEGLRRAGRPLVLCTLGGGKDGYFVAQNFVSAFRNIDACGLLLTGPFMPADCVQSLQAHVNGRDNLAIVGFSNQADSLIRQADGIVAMGGYNTVASILSFKKRALLVPRVAPRSEQWIRAQRLSHLDGIEVVHPSDIAPATIRQWVARLGSETPSTRSIPNRDCDLNGLERIVTFATQLLQHDPLQSTVSAD